MVGLVIGLIVAELAAGPDQLPDPAADERDEEPSPAEEAEVEQRRQEESGQESPG